MEQLERYRVMVEDYLKTHLSQKPAYGSLIEAMNYSLLAGGKRLRPVLTLAVCEMCGGKAEQVLPFACGVEMVHTYSLIHDDLPCMDDDDLRRGKPTSHKVFGEAMAVLAGDALLTGAFESLSEAELLPERIVQAVQCLAKCAGYAGMVGGQVLDMDGEGHALSRQELETLQSLKTGALIQAAAELGCIGAGGSQAQRQAVAHYARCLGRAFQIQDDILDVVSTSEALGKPVGSDVANDKSTFVGLLGLEECHALVQQLTQEAVEALAMFQNRDCLVTIAQQMAQRTH